MKRLWIVLPILFLTSTVHPDITINQTTSGGTLGTVNFAAFSGTIPAGQGMLMMAHGPMSLTQNKTVYQVPGNTLVDWDTTPTFITREVQAQVPFVAGTLSGLYVVVSGGNSLAAQIVVRTRINGLNGNQLITIPASSGIAEWSDATHTDIVSTGDKVDVQIVSGSGAGTATITAIGLVFKATANNTSPMIGSGVAVGNTSSNVFATYFTGQSGLGAQLTNQTENPNALYKHSTGGTYSQFMVYVATNTLTTGTVTLRIRKNRANGNSVLTIPAGATGIGISSDSTHTDTVVAGDSITYSIAMPGSGSGNFGITFLGAMFTTTDNTMDWPAWTEGSHSFSANETNIIAILGGAGYDSTEVGDYAIKAQQAGTLSNMRIHLETGGNLNQIATIAMRKNGANCGPLISVPASFVGGFLEDTVNTCVVTATDELDYRETVPAGTGSITWDYIGAKFTHN